MIISIHQPQYIPWLPYFAKIAMCDTFVFLDNVQFQKNGLQNRNELKNSNGRFWLTVPVSSSIGKKIKETKIADQIWSKKHIKTIKINYGKAKNYCFFEENIIPILNKEHESLAELNIEIIKVISTKFFKFNVKFLRQSEIRTTKKKSELILEICQILNAKKYLSGPTGKEYLDKVSFKNNNIEIEYFKNFLPDFYPQLYPKKGFINDISALDFILNTNKNWEKIL